MPVTHSRWFCSSAMMCAVVFILGCGGPAPLTVDMPLHLEEHLDAATIVGSEVPTDLPARMEWRFDEPQPWWETFSWSPPGGQPPTVRLSRTDDALQLNVTSQEGTFAAGGIYVDLPDVELHEWGSVLLRLRAKERATLLVGSNRGEDAPPFGRVVPRSLPAPPFQPLGPSVEVIHDGSLQTYEIPFEESPGRETKWRQLAVIAAGNASTTFDILSVSVIPRLAAYADVTAGVKSESRDGIRYRTLYTHAPGRIEYPVRVPDGGRLDVGLGVVTSGVPVTFRVTVTNGSAARETLLEEAYEDAAKFATRSVDLSHLAGKTVTLALEAESELEGAVALWVTPTVRGNAIASKPNIIFYVIDGAGADLMSVYGYNRRTTPNIERIAAEGAVFEYAHSNSGWTKPSTASFMTSLQHSVLGGFRNPQEALPDSVVTMAQRPIARGTRRQSSQRTRTQGV